MNKFDWLAIVILLAMFGLSWHYMPQMPEQMAVHWNAQGMADGYGSRFTGLFLLPIIGLGLYILLRIIPYIAPKKHNIEKFKDTYFWFMIIMIGFMAYIHVLSIGYNLGREFDFSKLMMPALAVIMFYAGVLMGKAKPNYFIGIRTPWTLSSKKVWDETHRLGSKLFKLAGIIILVSLAFPSEVGIIILLVAVLGAALISVVYSYMVFLKEKTA